MDWFRREGRFSYERVSEEQSGYTNPFIAAAEALPMIRENQPLYTYQPIHCEISRPGQP